MTSKEGTIVYGPAKEIAITTAFAQINGIRNGKAKVTELVSNVHIR